MGTQTNCSLCTGVGIYGMPAVVFTSTIRNKMIQHTDMDKSAAPLAITEYSKGIKYNFKSVTHRRFSNKKFNFRFL